jgi:hypothetical protein
MRVLGGLLNYSWFILLFYHSNLSLIIYIEAQVIEQPIHTKKR